MLKMLLETDRLQVQAWHGPGNLLKLQGKFKDILELQPTLKSSAMYF